MVVDHLIEKLKPNGILILAHCEGKLGHDTELVQIQPSIFQKVKK